MLASEPLATCSQVFKTENLQKIRMANLVKLKLKHVQRVIRCDAPKPMLTWQAWSAKRRGDEQPGPDRPV
ncbi:hypothetical protein NDU88_008312 [Pleurodeles waltl]|uniref:Uncharacterized protein n=1 Tax=Pleurodeles waltl TaxID=8319 RepID=A0AAV7QQD0_PLEWA|nr:hypothetical protein NDU88_008312 [Pleurodeles waltl]